MSCNGLNREKEELAKGQDEQLVKRVEGGSAFIS
jgi:hypothetical protein